MNEIELPNLLPDEVTPFLAAVGVVTLLCYDLADPTATLHWPDPLGPARIRSDTYSSLDDLAEGLRSVAVGMSARGELLPGAGAGFPPSEGSKSDPTKVVPLEVGREWARTEQGRREGRPWLPAVFATNRAAHSDKVDEPVLLRNPIYDAGPGTVWMSRTLEPLRDHALKEGVLNRSLSVGVRRAGHIGGYLDWRADRDASQAASGRDDSTRMGDPGLTWLAFMATRLVSLVAVGDRAVSSLNPPSRSKEIRTPLVWPVWSQPLRSPGIEVLLGHSAIQSLHKLADQGDADPGRAPEGRSRRRDLARQLQALHLHAVYAAPRILKGNNNGAYGPAVRVWPEG